MAWNSAGNFNNSFKRFQIFFRTLSLAQFDFFIFPKMKIKLKSRRFDTVEEIEAERQTVMNNLTKKHLQNAFQKRKKRWDWFVLSQSDIFEGDGA
jgi:hypothetical protein